MKLTADRKKVLLIAVGLIFAGPVLMAGADAPQVLCVGTESGGNGPRQYAYDVTGGLLLMSFTVGTNDLNSDNYTNLLMPENWNFAVEQEGMNHAHRTKTPHGSVSLGPCYCLTEGRVRWWTEDTDYGIPSAIFGYDHPWSSEDVGWLMVETVPPEAVGHITGWELPVGTGLGPVHGPALEPLPGDANGDGIVSADDYASVQLHFGDIIPPSGECWVPGDANGDGIVSADDYASVQANFGATAGLGGDMPVPEPATLLLLAIGGLAMLSKRRRT